MKKFLYSKLESYDQVLNYENFYYKVIKEGILYTGIYTLWRAIFFARVVNYYKLLNFNYPTILRIFYNVNYSWFLFLEDPTIDNYKKVIELANEYYYNVIIANDILSSKATYMYPGHFLLKTKINSRSLAPASVSIFKELRNYFLNVPKEKAEGSVYWGIFRKFGLASDVLYSESKFNLFFLRVQRRYNKRRYSRVKAFSRPSFFGGIALSSTFVGSFWGGTMKGVDWNTPLLTVVDINLVLYIIICYGIFRFIKLKYPTAFYRNRYRKKIEKFINNIFFTNSLLV